MKIKKGFQTVPGESIIQNAYPEGSVMFPDISKSYRVVAQTDCHICGSKADVFEDNQKYDGLRLECPKCKRFEITRTLMHIGDFNNLTAKQKDKLSRYVAEYYIDFEKPFELNSNNYKIILTLPKDFNFLASAQEQYQHQGISYEKSLYNISEQIKWLKLTKKLELSLHHLITEVENGFKPEQKRTNANNVIFMQEVARQLKPKGPYIDLAVGMGGLVWRLQNVTHLQDINNEVLSVSNVICRFCGNSPEVLNKDSISEELPNNGKGVFLFDPPMGAMRVKPKEWEAIQQTAQWVTQNIEAIKTNVGEALQFRTGMFSKEILGDYAADSSSATEILFLTNFLLRAADDAYFVCLVPETFLNRNEKEYNKLRRYLVQNSLISVIKPNINSGINTVILVGQKKREEKYQKISIANVFANITQNEMQGVIKLALLTPEYSDEKYSVISHDIAVLLEDEICEIRLPRKKTTTPKHRHPKEIIADIRSNELKLKPLRVKIMSECILEHYQVEQTTPVSEAKKEEPWFIAEYIQIRSKPANPELGYNHRRQDDKHIEYVSHLYLKRFAEKNLLLYSNDLKTAEILTNKFTSFEDIQDMAKLFYCGRVKKEKNMFILNLQKNMAKNKKYTEKQKEFFKICSPVQISPKINELLHIADDFAKNVYTDICKFYCLKISQNDTNVNDKELPNIIRSLEILEKLCLIKKKDERDKFIYNNYTPLHPWIDGDFIC